LVAAKDINEVVQLHADYVRKQMDVLARQADELSQSATKMGSEGGPSGKR